MHFSKVLIFGIAGFAAGAVAREATQKPWDHWSPEKMGTWLDEHGVDNPGNLNPTQLKHLVSTNYDNPPYSTWSDNKLVSWFGSNGLFAPQSSSQTSSSFAPSSTSWGEWGPIGWFHKEHDEKEHKNWRERMERAVKRSWDDSIEGWNESDLKEWLEDHGIVTPPKSTPEQLRDYVQSYFPTVQSHLDSFRVKTAAEKDSAAQTFFSAYNRVPSSEEVSNRLLQTWSDSQLRDFLLTRGVINPSGKREELILSARKLVSNEQSRLDRLREVAKEKAEKAGEWGGEAWYAALDAPVQSYDYVKDVVGKGQGYIWSAWSESDLRQWLEDRGVVAAPKSTYQELSDAVKNRYTEASTHVYDTWNDNALRSWLEHHGVVRTKQAKTRDELLDLMARNYYGARDTTWHYWSDSQIHRWLESRGLIKSNEQKSREELVALMEDNYFTLRDKPYQAWDQSMVKKYLQDKGVIENRTSFEIKRDDALKLMSEYYHDTGSYVWDTWSTAQERAWLVKEGILSAPEAANKQRHELESVISDNWNSGWESLEHSWKESDIRQWLIDSGYMKSDAQAKKDEVYDLFKKNYKAASKSAAGYTSWADNRLRGWLRDAGVDVPMNSRREELLQLMKENYVSTQGTFQKIANWVSGNLDAASGKLSQARIQNDLNAAEAAASKTLSASAKEASKTASSAAKAASASASKARSEL